MSVLSTPSETEADHGKAAVAPRPFDQDVTAKSNQTHRDYFGANRLCRHAVLRRLAKVDRGSLSICDGAGCFLFGDQEGDSVEGSITVHDHRFYRHVVFGGGLGAAEAYIRGYWDSPNLTDAMRVLAQNQATLAGVERGAARWMRPLRSAANWFRRNTKVGSRRNIAAHYDLSNEFFATMLDPTMTYSSGYFATPESSLEDASVEKYDRICRKLDLKPHDHLIEIGTGWGGFAEHAARHYGCRVTTTTISTEQHDYARERFATAGVADRVTLLTEDYRDLTGTYDKLVSIEMIEAVGEEFLPTYFAKCSALLKPGGKMALQAITIPDERYDRYRKSVDFIQRYIFPGGFLPSPGAISQIVADETELSISDRDDMGQHYAETLSQWRDRFHASLPKVRSLGFDERFIRTWRYYLCYCEAGFRERQIDVSQYLLTKAGK